MKPVLYRYKDTESVVRAMDGYTPGEGWTPLFEAPATAPERKPMPTLEVNARWEQSVLDITRQQYQQVVREIEAFHGIKETQ